MQFFSKVLNIPVAGSIVDLAVIGGQQDSETTIVVKNVGTKALTAFEVWVRNNPDADYFRIASAAGDYTTPTGLLLYCRDNTGAALSPVTLASGAEVILVVNTKAIESVKLRATAAAPTNDTLLSIFANVGGAA